MAQPSAVQRACLECGALLPPRKPGPGRLRLRCESCRPRPVSRVPARSQDLRTCARCGVEFRDRRRPGPPAARCEDCRVRRGAVHDAAYRRRCQGCGAMRRDDTWIRWCSSSCRPPRRGPSRPSRPRFSGEKNCEWCDCTFLTSNSRVRFCSPLCRRNGRMAGKSSVIPWMECTCGDWYLHRSGRKRCSEGCRSQRWSSVIKVCGECRIEFNTSRGQNNQQKYCSEACSRRAKRRGVRARYGRRDNLRKKARQLGVRYEPVSPVKVFNRDGWRCGLCRKTVNRNLKHPHPLSPSLDHIIPMNEVDQGDHTYVNVQCAHLRCNYLKGRTGSSQLRLVG